MKQRQSIPIKNTTKLFSGKYKYKIVLRTSAASWFRKTNLESFEDKLTDYKNGKKQIFGHFKLESKEEAVYAEKVYRTLLNFTDFNLRIEYPLISVYSTDEALINALIKLDKDRVKYACFPEKDSNLVENTVIVKRIDYDYKVYLGRTHTSYTSFIQWSENNKKIRLTGRAKTDLLRPKSWGGGYFYVKDEKTLTMVKMFVGAAIHKIENVIKA